MPPPSGITWGGVFGYGSRHGFTPRAFLYYSDAGGHALVSQGKQYVSDSRPVKPVGVVVVGNTVVVRHFIDKKFQNYYGTYNPAVNSLIAQYDASKSCQHSWYSLYNLHSE